MKVVITKTDDGRYEWVLVDANGESASWNIKTYSDARGARRGAHRWLWKLCGALSYGGIKVEVHD